MKIAKYTYRSRRDFKALFECEACNHTTEEWGYDDPNFHENVIPKMICKECGTASGKQTSTNTIPEGIVL